jgi:oxaloacetate decarboxylase gamma subunit
MITGMGFVFGFLTLLVFTINLMSKLALKYAPAAEENKPSRPIAKNSPSASSSHGTDATVLAAISTAVKLYRDKHKS